MAKARCHNFGRNINKIIIIILCKIEKVSFYIKIDENLVELMLMVMFAKQ